MMRALLEISDHADLHDADDVLMYVAKKNVKESFKANLIDFYRHYADFYGIQFIKVRYRRDHRIPRVPLVEKIDMLIARASKKYAIMYSMINECGLRPVEVAGLTLDDIDLEKGILSVNTAKHGSPRMLRLKEKTFAMLNDYVKLRKFGMKDKLFDRSSTWLQRGIMLGPFQSNWDEHRRISWIDFDWSESSICICPNVSHS
jgi:integrase